MLKLLFTGRRLWLTLLVLAGALICCRLGIWQLDRLAQRRAQNALINERMAQPAIALDGAQADPATLDYQRVEARGVYDPTQEIVLRNRALNGSPGVHVLTPLRLNGGDTAVLVDRGWLPLELAQPAARLAYAEPPGPVVVQGVARRSQSASGGPQDPPLPAGESRRDAWFRVDIPEIEQQVGYRLLPVFIEQQPAPGDPGLPRRVATGDLGEGSHLSYTVQWFSFAIILVMGYLARTYQQLKHIT
ncbi:MAG TPA: SURF1 family protein [Roseiflexaceae bacterium]|nr:SURF1 family protein [Roseiflexaceae bacterium]